MQKKAKFGMNLSIADLLYANPSKDLSEKDYYPGGMVIPERSFSSAHYRYGFNNQEGDDEIKGFGNSYDFGERMVDVRLSRPISVDPLAAQFPWWSPYQFAGNSPIRFIDLDGAEAYDPLVRFLITDAAITLVQNPSSVMGKAYGGLIGVGGSAGNMINAVGTFVRHPINTTINTSISIGHILNKSPIENAVDYGLSMYSLYGDLPESVQEFAIGAHAVTDLSLILLPFKGGGLKTTTAVKGVAVEEAIAIRTGNLGNPFKNVTLSQVDQAAQIHVQNGKLQLKYVNPKSGAKSYLNPKSGYSYNLDPGGMYGKKLELPHIDVNYPNPKPLNVSPKKKLSVAGGF